MEVESSTEQKVLLLTEEDLFTIAGKKNINSKDGWEPVSARLWSAREGHSNPGVSITFRRNVESD